MHGSTVGNRPIHVAQVDSNYVASAMSAIVGRRALRSRMYTCKTRVSSTSIVRIGTVSVSLNGDSAGQANLGTTRVASNGTVARIYLPGWVTRNGEEVSSTVIVVSDVDVSVDGLGDVESDTTEVFDPEYPYVYTGATGVGEWVARAQVIAIGTAADAELQRSFRKDNTDKMWISLIIALVTYLASSKSNPEDKKKALLNAGLAGAGTAFVTSQTDWGKDVNSTFNGYVGLDDSWTGFSGEGAGPDDGKVPGRITPPVSSGSGGSIFSSLPSWAGPAAGGVAVGAALSDVPTWVWLVGGGLLAYSLIKD